MGEILPLCPFPSHTITRARQYSFPASKFFNSFKIFHACFNCFDFATHICHSVWPLDNSGNLKSNHLKTGPFCPDFKPTLLNEIH